MAQILDGKLVSQKMRERLRREVEELAAEGIVPGLAVVLVPYDFSFSCKSSPPP